MISAKAFAPANISCFFKVFEHKNPRWRGSYGCGFTINKGVTAEVYLTEKTRLEFNGELISLPAVEKVLLRLSKKNILIQLSSPLPLGHGYGISGASALATAYALNELLHLEKEQKELAIIAHTAEVESKTGLGDVVNEWYGGALVKFQPSSKFVAHRLPFEGTTVYCRSFERLSTKSIISHPNIKNRINNSATDILNTLEKNIENQETITFKDIVKLSKQFAQQSGLLTHPKVMSTIQKIEADGGVASMIMLGNGVFSTMPFEGCTTYQISNTPAQVIREHTFQ